MNKLVLVSCAVLLSSTASAAEMGDRNTIALSGAASAGTTSIDDSKSSASFVAFAPEIAWFFADGASVSISPHFLRSRSTYEGQRDETSTVYGGTLRFGDLVGLADRVSLWPQIGVYVDRATTSGTVYDSSGANPSAAPTYMTDESTAYGVNAEIPIVVAITRHTFATFSFITADVEKQKHTTFRTTSVSFNISPQASIGFGGWF